jgi:hypothetical protein
MEAAQTQRYSTRRGEEMDESMAYCKAFKAWWEGITEKRGIVGLPDAFEAGFNAGWEARMPKKPLPTFGPEDYQVGVNHPDFIRGWSLAQDEHLPTLEGVIDYLERQNEQAFLAYRRLERGSEPGMNKDVRIRLMEYAYEQWQATGEALHKAKEAAKNPSPGVTYIDTIQGMLDRHFGKRI